MALPPASALNSLQNYVQQQKESLVQATKTGYEMAKMTAFPPSTQEKKELLKNALKNSTPPTTPSSTAKYKEHMHQERNMHYEKDKDKEYDSNSSIKLKS